MHSYFTFSCLVYNIIVQSEIKDSNLDKREYFKVVNVIFEMMKDQIETKYYNLSTISEIF